MAPTGDVFGLYGPIGQEEMMGRERTGKTSRHAGSGWVWTGAVARILAIAAIASSGMAKSPDLVIAMPNWPSGQATASILKVAIKAEFGLDAELREMGPLGSFAEMEKGQVAIRPEVWRPNNDDLIRRYVTEKKAVVLTGRSTEAWQGLCATEQASALGIRNIADLSDPAKTSELDTDGNGTGEIWIGSSLWLSTGIERVRANSYGYGKTVTLVEAEEDVAMAAVDAAVATGEPMVFYCYSPHHLFKLHKITRIAEPAYDPAKWKIADFVDPMWIDKSSAPVSWDTARFHFAYAAAFGKAHPDIAAFLEKLDFSPEEITGMSYALQVERQVPLDFATKWVADHKARVEGWAKP
jgi:glycine betaine/proline transport system substrate-binding protein